VRAGMKHRGKDQRSSKSKVNPNRISMSRLNARAAFVPKFQRRSLGFLGACVSFIQRANDSESRGRKIATAKRTEAPTEGAGGARCKDLFLASTVNERNFFNKAS